MYYYVSKEQKLFKDYEIRVCSIDYVLDYFKNHEEIAVDTETTGFSPHSCKVLCLQIGDAYNQFVIDTTTIDIKRFKDLLESKVNILQNAKFDLRFFYKHGIVVTKVFDTFLAEMLLSLGLRKIRRSLDALTQRYCKINMDKTVRGVIHREGLSIRVIKYAAKDVQYLNEIKEKQLEKIKELNLERALNVENKFVSVLAYIEYCGIYLNIDKWKAKMKQDNKELQDSLTQLNDFILNSKDKTLRKYINTQIDLFTNKMTCNINWASPHQVIPLLKDLGVNTKVKDKKTGEYKDSCSSDVIRPQKHLNPILPIYLKYKEASKVVSTYGQNWLDIINKNTKRIHTEFRQLQNTTRVASGNKEEDAPNIQNVPSDNITRECFTNQLENTILINADYSGQEQIILANFSQDPALLEFYDKGMSDMHSFIASKIFDIPYEELIESVNKKDKGGQLNKNDVYNLDCRKNAKAAGFAINYGGDGNTISNNLGVSLEIGNKLYEEYFQLFTGLKPFFKSCAKQTFRDGYVLINPLTKHKSFIYGFEEFKRSQQLLTKKFWDEYRYNKKNYTDEFINYYKPLVSNNFKMKGAIERHSVNYRIQGTSAVVTKLAAYFIFEELIKRDLLFSVKIVNIIHDEIMLECPIKKADNIAKLLENSMKKAGDIFCKRVPLKAESVITNYWTH